VTRVPGLRPEPERACCSSASRRASSASILCFWSSAGEQLPRDARVFFHDAHFSEEGSSRLAELVAGHLLAREPLAEFR
jgi:hypothetical protein